MQNKLICCLLLIIIICSSILIYKINLRYNYSQDTYDQIYQEYNEITNIATDLQNNEIEISNSLNNTNVIDKNSTPTNNTVGIIDIPKIEISYPIINKCTEENLNIAPCKLLGPTINTEGNLVILGHNNWNKDFFSNLHKLEKDDIVILTDKTGNKVTYKLCDKYQIEEDDFSCVNQDTDGRIELTLITCVKYKKNKRLVIKCVAI